MSGPATANHKSPGTAREAVRTRGSRQPIGLSVAAGLWSGMGRDREREVLRTYLDDIQAHVQGKDPGEATRALREMRSHLRRDLLVGNVSEKHYQTLQARLAEAVDATRQAELTPLLARLPPGLRVRFQVLMDDGVLTDEEFDTFAKMIDLADLQDAVKKDIVQSLRTWVEEDRGRHSG